MVAIAIIDTLVSAAIFYAGYRYGARDVAAVKAEIARIEKEYSNLVVAGSDEVKYVMARIKNLL